MSSDEELLAIAQEAVPDHLKPLGRVVRRSVPTEAVTASGPHAPADDSLIRSLAEEVGAKLGNPSPDSGDVEFVEHTKVGSRSTIVQVRGGKIARVLKRA